MYKNEQDNHDYTKAPYRLGTSAGAITACGLLELSKRIKNESESKKHIDWTRKIFKGLKAH